MRLRLSRRAQGDLDGVRDYTVEHYGTARAILYLDVIEQGFRRILAYPQIGAAQPEVKTGLQSLSAGEHRLWYRVESEEIVILRVLHKAMDPARHL
ncbi:type II toxin-antitoxin system RelE/ParE family toxin [Sphingomonas sp. PAMC 26621]|uniref:type II toxin-antitoxin system RelE/ParE family toxin n=1 Tax=Sphingomonas sp. PAMC 26621 TaxID=1112213 RepID=UPI00028A3401|nr:type II toxin-antitoxin system RelE/ParE family toxin [Sphingomonas sp. PAMC 26621]